MTKSSGRRWGTFGLLLAVFATSAALLATAGPALAAPASSSESTSSCWKDVVNDWLVHEPNVVGSYPIACYTQAIQHLNAYQDLRGYSSAADDIRRAMLAALHSNGGIGPGGSSGGSGPNPSGHSDSGGGGKSIVTKIFDAVGPGNAESVPLPLIVLAGLAFLLLLAALATYVAKRIQGRRIAPAPARSTPRR